MPVALCIDHSAADCSLNRPVVCGICLAALCCPSLVESVDSGKLELHCGVANEGCMFEQRHTRATGRDADVFREVGVFFYAISRRRGLDSNSSSFSVLSNFRLPEHELTFNPAIIRLARNIFVPTRTEANPITSNTGRVDKRYLEPIRNPTLATRARANRAWARRTYRKTVHHGVFSTSPTARVGNTMTTEER